MNIFISSDHGGFETKSFLIKKLEKLDLKINDCGPFKYNKDDDYPDTVKELILRIACKKNSIGILCCRSGIGMSIMANRHPKIRASLCHNAKIAKMARKHNNANVLCLGSDFLKKEEILNIVKTFLEEKFEGGRHKRRIKKIEKYSKNFYEN